MLSFLTQATARITSCLSAFSAEMISRNRLQTWVLVCAPSQKRTGSKTPWMFPTTKFRARCKVRSEIRRPRCSLTAADMALVGDLWLHFTIALKRGDAAIALAVQDHTRVWVLDFGLAPITAKRIISATLLNLAFQEQASSLHLTTTWTLLDCESTTTPYEIGMSEQQARV